MILKNGVWWQGDCLDVMKRVPDGSVDMILCDLPYGTTQNKWDSVIPFEPLWREYWRVAKPRAAVVLTASQPFTAALVMSQVRNFKYEWTWNKSMKTGQLNAKKRPLVGHESILVFYREQCFYEPYSEIENPKAGTNATPTGTKNYGRISGQESYTRPDMLTKDSVIKGFPVGSERGFHPTQKPVALFEYLIRTYTNPGDVVLDNCAGSGTTAIACENLDRHWVCIERDPDYSRLAIERITAHGR